MGISGIGIVVRKDDTDFVWVGRVCCDGPSCVAWKFA